MLSFLHFEHCSYPGFRSFNKITDELHEFSYDVFPSSQPFITICKAVLISLSIVLRTMYVCTVCHHHVSESKLF